MNELQIVGVQIAVQPRAWRVPAFVTSVDAHAVSVDRRVVSVHPRGNALLGAVLRLFVGAGLGIGVVSSLHADGITATAVPGGNLLLYAAAAACFGLLAAIFPAIRASRIDVLRAVTTE